MSRLAAGLAAALLACGAHAGNATDAPAKTTTRVEIRNFAFSPRTLTVKAGTRITWTNRDEEPHVVVSAGKQFGSSPALDTGDSYAATFATPGTYAYYCAIHPMMTGTIIVQ